MKKAILLLTVSFLAPALSWAELRLTPSSARAEPTVENELVVEFKSVSGKSAQDRLKNLNAAWNVQSVKTLSSTQVSIAGLSPRSQALRDRLSRMAVLRLSPGTPIDSAIAAYRKNANLAAVGAHKRAHTLLTPSDPYYSSAGAWGQNYDDLWGLKKISAASAWDISTGTGVVVAVIDSGVDYTHPDLQGRLWIDPSTGQPGYNMVNRTSDPMDRNGHGTHVAGTIAGASNTIGIVGLAFNSQIMGLKGIDDNGSGFDMDLADAIVWATDHGAKVMNLSWGFYGVAPAVQTAIQYAHSRDVVVVVAAGNDNADVSASQSFPADMPEVITVGASNPVDEKASFSNYGVKIDVVAPGGDDAVSGNSLQVYNILSLKSATSLLAQEVPQLVVGGQYLRIAGTSMASPHVAALAALLRSLRPTLTNEEIRLVLRISADDVGTSGFDIFTGAGRINARRALEIDRIMTSQIVSPLPQSLIESSVNIVGSAGGPGFSSYTLDVSSNGVNWTLLAQQNTPVSNGTLGVFNPAVFGDGIYTLRLRVPDGQGHDFTSTVQIRVDYVSISSPVAPDLPTTAEVYKPGSTIAITGKAAWPNFTSYDLEWARGLNATSGFSSQGISLTGGTPPAGGGTLATWNTTGISQADYYTLRLTVHNTSEATTQATTVVYLEPDLASSYWPKNLDYSTFGFRPLYPVKSGSRVSHLMAAGADFVSQFTPDGRESSRSELLGGPIAVGGDDGSEREFTVVGEFGHIRRLNTDGGTSILYTQASTDFSIGYPQRVDVDGDLVPDVLWASLDFKTFNDLSVHVLSPKGELLSNFSIGDHNWLNPYLRDRLVAVDLNRDGVRELVAISGDTPNDFSLQAYDLNGQPFSPWSAPNFPNAFSYNLAAADLDHDGQMQIVLSYYDLTANEFVIAVYNSDGSIRPGWPIRRTAFSPFFSYAGIGDLDGDGHDELAFSLDDRLEVYRSDAQVYPGYPVTLAVGQYFGPFAIGDVTGDGAPDLVISHLDASATAPFPLLPNAERLRLRALAGRERNIPGRAQVRDARNQLMRRGVSVIQESQKYYDYSLDVYSGAAQKVKSWKVLGGKNSEYILFDPTPSLGEFLGNGKVAIATNAGAVNFQTFFSRGVETVYATSVDYEPKNHPWPLPYADTGNSSVLAHVVVESTPRALGFEGLSRVMPLSAKIKLSVQGRFSEIQWTLTAQNAPIGSPAAGASSVLAPGASFALRTKGVETSFESFSVLPGEYILSAVAVSASGKASAKVEAPVTLVSSDHNNVIVYPSPWVAGKHAPRIVFSGLTQNASVKIFNVAGQWVKTLSGSSGEIEWNLENDGGQAVASGIYLYVIVDGSGEKSRGKFGVVR